MAGNRPARERFEFSLDARQVAGVTLGSLGALALAFLLGSATGQRMAERPAAAPRPAAQAPAAAPADPLAALDQPVRPDGGEPQAPLSFHESLTSARPPPDRLPPGPKVQPAAVAPSSAGPSGPAAQGAPPAPVVAAVATGTAARPVAPPAPAPTPPAASPPTPVAAPSPVVVPSAVPPAPVAKPAAGKGAWVVQVGSTQERFEADRIAARYASRGARVTVAEVPGKGRWYRVRLGAFETRDAADRYLKDFERSTGAKGFVAANN